VCFEKLALEILCTHFVELLPPPLQYGLVCFERLGNEAVGYCHGTGIDTYDYCIPAAPHTLILMGPPGSHGLGKCEGDCDLDSDCLVRTF
jgi:hypothetical protein